MLKLIPHLYKNIIHVGRSKFRVSILSLPFQFFCAVIYLQLEVRPIIIWLVVGGSVSLEDKWGDVVGLDNMCVPIIKVAVISVKEEELLIDLASSTGPTEETHFLHPAIPVHISQRCVVD